MITLHNTYNTTLEISKELMSRFITPNYYNDDPEMAAVKGGLLEIENECLLHSNSLPLDTPDVVLEDRPFDDVYEDFSTKY